jgi:hypothetical protein
MGLLNVLTEPVDGFTEVLPAVVAEVILELGLRVDEYDAPRVYGLASTDPAAPADIHNYRIPVPNPDDAHGAFILSRSDALDLGDMLMGRSL